MKAVTYCRYSSDQQRATSLEDQQRNCQRRADAEGWEVVQTYADAAISGSDANRPEYQRMLAAAMGGEFDVLLVDDLSRFARDSIEQEKSIRRLEFQGVRIIAVSDGYDSQSKARKVHRGFKGLMNEIFLDDLRDKVHRGLEGQALKGFWCGGKPFGYRLRPILDPKRLDPYGQPVRIGTMLEVDPEQGPIVLRMFARYIEGASCKVIADELNRRGVPSPGSTWKRKTRRCGKWMNSAVRSILKNPLYTGRQRWNRYRYEADPDTRKDRKRARPESEWTVHQVESLRLVSDEVFERAQARTRVCANSAGHLKSGGRAKYVLSGLLTCGSCGAHYVMGDSFKYVCSSYWNGGAKACSNATRVRRDAIEAQLLDPESPDSAIAELLAPARVARMAAELERQYAEEARSRITRAGQRPRALEELLARIERLRQRLKGGDPDMTADELRAALAVAEGKLQALEAQQPAAKAEARVLSMLPRAAERYVAQVRRGLNGDPREAMKARAVLRDLLTDGRIVLTPGEEAGSLWATGLLAPKVLLRAAAGTVGRGDWI